MTPDALLIQQEAVLHKLVRLEPRVYEIDTLGLPAACSLIGAGPGLTELRLVGDAPVGIAIERLGGQPATTLRDFTLTTSKPRDVGIQVTSPQLFFGNRGHAAELTLEHVEVRPAAGYETVAAFKRGVVVENIADARIRDVRVIGRFQDLTEAWFAESSAMDIAFDLRGSQEAKLSECYVHGARRGFLSGVPTAGCGEGHSVTQSAFINVLTAVELQGVPAGINGGFNTPWVTITDNHFFYLQKGVLAVNYSDLRIAGNSFCISHFNNPDSWKVGVYLVQCANARISDNNFWSTKPGQSISLMADRSHRGTFHGNTVDPSMTYGAFLTGGSSNWVTDNATKPALTVGL